MVKLTLRILQICCLAIYILGPLSYSAEQGLSLNDKLLQATKAGDLTQVDTLLQHGADIEASTSRGETVLMVALRYHRYNLVERLLKEKPDLHRTSTRGTVLHYATYFSRNTNLHFVQPSTKQLSTRDIINKLIRAGAPLGVRNKSHDTAFQYAARSEDVGILQIFLDEGSRVDAPAQDSLPILCRASLQATEKLLTLGADPNQQGYKNITPLLCAVENHLEFADQKRKIELLIKYGADVNHQDSRGESVLQRAIRSGAAMNSPIIWRILLDSGAIVTTASEDGRTSLHVLASRCKSMETGSNWPDKTKAKIACLDMANHLLEKGADVNATGNRGRTPLFDTSETMGDTSVYMAEWLLKAGANPNAAMTRGSYDSQHRGTTPLMEAAVEGNIEMVKLLIASGADPHMKDEWGWHAACYARTAHLKGFYPGGKNKFYTAKYAAIEEFLADQGAGVGRIPAAPPPATTLGIILSRPYYMAMRCPRGH